MAEHEREPPSNQPEIELPEELIESFARFLVPEIRKYYESEQGQWEFKEWEKMREARITNKAKAQSGLKCLDCAFAVCKKINQTPWALSLFQCK